MPKYIFIPTVTQDLKTPLIEVYSSEVGPLTEAHQILVDKGISSMALGVQSQGLANIAQTVVECVRSFEQNRQNADWLEKQRLYSTGRCVGDSIKLGMAIALLMYDKDSYGLNIIATGNLGGYKGNITVEPVAGIREKFDQVYNELKDSNEISIFFTPTSYIDDNKNIHNIAIDFKTEIEQLASIGVEVKPIFYLKEVLDFFNLKNINPYLGLSTFQFQEDHIELFFGRTKDIDDAINKLTGRNKNNQHVDGKFSFGCYRWLQIEGNSGIGKSSFVNAGILPKIKGNEDEPGALVEVTDFNKWRIGSMTPGDKPLEQLAISIEKLLKPDVNQQDPLALLHKLKQDEISLRLAVNTHKESDTGYILVIDQFEEFFTSSDKQQQRNFVAQLNEAITGDCPLFFITTVRFDFLDSFNEHSLLLNIYNTHCQRYILPSISHQGLREIIEEPAKKVGLDVTEVTELLLNDALDEIGTLPLVENALFYLYEERINNRLSAKIYSENGGLTGLLETQADAKLNSLNEKDKRGALELFLAMTRISPEGHQHTRHQISQKAAQRISGFGDLAHGQKIIDYLAGGRLKEDNYISKNKGVLRLITSDTRSSDNKNTDIYYNLIHETLIRTRVGDTNEKKPYWGTLHKFIEHEDNKNRYLYKRQLERNANQWHAKKGIQRWFNLATQRDLKLYKDLLLSASQNETNYLRHSRNMLWVKRGLLALSLPLLLMAANAIKIQKHNKIGEFDQITSEPLLNVQQLVDQAKSLQYKNKEPLSVMIVYSEKAPYEEVIVNSFIKHLESKVGNVNLSIIGPIFNMDGDVITPGGSCQAKSDAEIRTAWADQINRVMDRTNVKNKKIDYFVTLGTYVSNLILKGNLVSTHNAKGVLFLGVTDPVEAGLINCYKNRNNIKSCVNNSKKGLAAANRDAGRIKDDNIAGVRYGSDKNEDYGNTIGSVFSSDPEQKLVFVHDTIRYPQDGYVATHLKKYKEGKDPRFKLRDEGVDKNGDGISDVLIGLEHLAPTQPNSHQEVYFAWYGLDNILRNTTKSMGDEILRGKWVVPSTYSVDNLNKAGVVVSVNDQEVGKLGADIVFESYLHPELNLGDIDIGTPKYKIWLDCSVIKNDKKGLKLASPLPETEIEMLLHPEDCPSVQYQDSK